MLKKIALLTVLGVIVGMTGACGTSGDTKTYEFLVTQSADLQDGQLLLSAYDRKLVIAEEEFTATDEDIESWNMPKRIVYKAGQATTITKREAFEALVRDHNDLVQGYNTMAERLDWTPFSDLPDQPPQKLDEFALSQGAPAEGTQ